MDANQRRQFENLPIPTYEEAISSRQTSSHNYRGTTEISDDAERQGLLGQESYRPPTVESARSSEDSDLRLPEVEAGEGDDDRRHIIEELDYLDPADDDLSSRRGLYHRARLRSQFSKHLANLSATFSSIRIPSFRSLYAPVATAESDGPTTNTTSSPRGRWVVPERYRISAPTAARLCGLATLGIVIYVLFALDMFRSGRRIGAHFDPESVRLFVQENLNPENIKHYLHHLTSYDHVAGTEGDYYLASWMEEYWSQSTEIGGGGGFDKLGLLDYYVHLTYPTVDGRSVKILGPEDKTWTAALEEGMVDPRKQQTLAFHGHSKSGTAKGHLIYANDGKPADFQWLQEHEVELEGAIALIRYSSFLGQKIKNAEDAGCAGVLIFSEPSTSSTVDRGQIRPDDAVQRGGVGLTNQIIGDPLTPGWASQKGAKTKDTNDNPGLPGIPSLPLSWRDAKVLISALEGRGVRVPKEAWIPDSGKENGGIDKWYSGSKELNHIVVEVKNVNDENDKQKIWNLHGMIEGLETPKKRVIVGSHRDSWCFGAVDPGSGSAVLMEVVKIFLDLRRLGWRPLRTIEFVSWDANEYNVMGSTEYVEDKTNLLRESGIAYLNVDSGVSGGKESIFRAQGSPILNKALMHVLGRVSDPVANTTLRQLWNSDNGHIHTPYGFDRSFDDTLPFQTIAGTSSLDFGFSGKDSKKPFALENSCYETFEWMQKFGDPDFSYHHTLAQIWALMILEIADRPLIPFDLNAYADAILFGVKQLQQDAENAYSRQHEGKALTPESLTEAGGLSTTPLKTAGDELKRATQKFHKFEDQWTSHVLGAGGLETSAWSHKRERYNAKLAMFETDLLDLPENKGVKDGNQHGIPGREQFKHILFAPSISDDGGKGVMFPAVRDAIQQGDWKQAQEMVEKAARILVRAGRTLVDNDQQ